MSQLDNDKEQTLFEAYIELKSLEAESQSLKADLELLRVTDISKEIN